MRQIQLLIFAAVLDTDADAPRNFATRRAVGRREYVDLFLYAKYTY
jgi:hypothetical protein